MSRRLLRRFMISAVGLGMLLVAVASSASVSAAPPQLFTNNGCAVGNYTCLRDAGVFPFNRGYRGAFYGNYVYGAVPYYSVGYVNPYYAPVYGAPAPATTTGSVVSGHTASVGQSVSVTDSGFTPGESVAATVTAPNGQITQVGSAAAAADGTVTITVTFPSAGAWQVTAKGQSSGKSVVTPYTVQ